MDGGDGEELGVAEWIHGVSLESGSAELCLPCLAHVASACMHRVRLCYGKLSHRRRLETTRFANERMPVSGSWFDD